MATTSAGDSTTHIKLASRCGVLQMKQNSDSVSMRQR
jgi:hypothetical protein